MVVSGRKKQNEKGVFMGMFDGCASNRGTIDIATNTFSQ